MCIKSNYTQGDEERSVTVADRAIVGHDGDWWDVDCSSGPPWGYNSSTGALLSDNWQLYHTLRPRQWLCVHRLLQRFVHKQYSARLILRLRQHNIGYTADGFYRSDDPTNSVKALKEGG